MDPASSVIGEYSASATFQRLDKEQCIEMKAFGNITKSRASLVPRRSVDVVNRGLGHRDGCMSHVLVTEYRVVNPRVTNPHRLFSAV